MEKRGFRERACVYLQCLLCARTVNSLMSLWVPVRVVFALELRTLRVTAVRVAAPTDAASRYVSRGVLGLPRPLVVGHVAQARRRWGGRPPSSHLPALSSRWLTPRLGPLGLRSALWGLEHMVAGEQLVGQG